MPTAVGSRAHPLAVPRRLAVEDGVRADAAHEQVQVVLPRVADAAVDLQAVLGELVGHVADVGGDHLTDLAGVAGPLAATASAAADGTGLAGLEVHRLVGHDVLERLERADRSAERDAVLGVLRRSSRTARPSHRRSRRQSARGRSAAARSSACVGVRRASSASAGTTATPSKSTWASRRDRSRQSSGVTVMPAACRRHEELHGRAVEFGDHEQLVGGDGVLHEAPASAQREAVAIRRRHQPGTAVPVAVAGRRTPRWRRPRRPTIAGQHLARCAVRAVGGDRRGHHVHRDERTGLDEAAELLGDRASRRSGRAAHAAAAVRPRGRAS